jgi:uncharacterized protein YndB with AHSA1/START domain
MSMEYGSLEREIHVEASPEVVFEVISRPEHIREWWSDDADFGPGVGATGEIVFGDRAKADAKVVPLTVVDTRPPRFFSFRWAYGASEVAAVGNSLLVTFELVPTGSGTVVRLTETGFRERGWEAAVLEAHYKDHATGWDFHLAHLVEYVARLGSS